MQRTPDHSISSPPARSSFLPRARLGRLSECQMVSTGAVDGVGVYVLRRRLFVVDRASNQRQRRRAEPRRIDRPPAGWSRRVAPDGRTDYATARTPPCA